MKSSCFFFQGFLTTGQPLPSSDGGRGEAQKCTSACINQHHPAPRGLKHPAEQPILHPSLQLLNPPAKPPAVPPSTCAPDFAPGPWVSSRGLSEAGPRAQGSAPSPRAAPPGWQLAETLTPARPASQMGLVLKTPFVFGLFVCFEFIQSLGNLWFWLEILKEQNKTKKPPPPDL